MYLAIFEFLGTSELLIILVVALILFGPRKLPQLSRQLGKSLGEFKRASEDFKRTWEKEVELERLEEEGRLARAMLQDDASILEANQRRNALETAATEPGPHTSAPADDWAGAHTIQPTVARSSSTGSTEQTAPPALAAEASAPETTGKRDWL